MMFGMLSSRFGWTPGEISDLTYPQIAGYMRYVEAFPVPYTMSVVPKE